MDTLLIPEGNLGHPVAYTLNVTHKHTYTNHSRKNNTHRENMFTGSGVYTDITVCIGCVSVDVTRKVVQRVQRDSVYVRVWIVQGLSTCACVCEDSAK